jgi:hypothetical protein
VLLDRQGFIEANGGQWPLTSPSPGPRRQPAKNKGTARIDGIVAAIIAIGRAMAERSPSLRTLCSLCN